MSMQELAALAVAGALGGAIYWAARTHGQVLQMVAALFARR